MFRLAPMRLCRTHPRRAITPGHGEKAEITRQANGKDGRRSSPIKAAEAAANYQPTPEFAALPDYEPFGAVDAQTREILQEQEASVKQGKIDIKADTAFHFLLAEAARNEILLRIMDSLMNLLHETREASLHTSGRSVSSLKQHKAIVRAIEARDPAAAERRMREHITGMEKLVFATQGLTNASADDAAKPSSASRAEISS